MQAYQTPEFAFMGKGFGSHAMKVGDLIYFSGWIPITPEGELVTEIKAATVRTAGISYRVSLIPSQEQCIKNLGYSLKAAGSSWEKVVKTNVYLTDMKDFRAMNEAYMPLMPSPAPCRTCVQVAGLPKGSIVEIECIASAL
ncbi:2-iminobutanoate/2-iminopropanoate deaminase, partial [Tremellales sp. Uapishka_1]